MLSQQLSPRVMVREQDNRNDSLEALRQEDLLRHLVKRSLLQAQIPSNQWSFHEADLLRLSKSILSSACEADMVKVADGIKRAVARDGDVSRGVEIAEALHAFIFSNHEMSKKAETLLFLLRLKERPELINPNRRFGGYQAPSDAMTEDSPRPLFETERLVIPKESPMNKAEIWKRFMESRTESVKIERILLKDLVNVLRGINGEYMRYDEAQQAFKLIPDPRITPLLSSLALELSKIGVAFLQIQWMLSFYRPECGLIAQGFRAGAEEELGEFYKTVALFESLVIESTDQALGMNLRRAVVWFTVPARKLRFLQMVIEDCKDVIGAPLIERVAKYKDHGNEYYKAIANGLLGQMCRPYLNCLMEWVGKGDLVDPHSELFIVQSRPIDGSVSGQDAWHKLYRVAEDKIPKGLFDEATVRQILLIGKTLNFAKVCDHHQQHHHHHQQQQDAMDIEGASRPESEVVEIESVQPAEATMDGLKRMLRESQRVACVTLSRRLFDQFRLKDHFLILKETLLLGRSDFALALLEALAECLSKPAGAIFRHNLVGVLETSLQGTFSAGSSPKEDRLHPLLGNVDVRLHEPSRDPNGSHQYGWDIFSLDYRVPVPLDAVLGDEAMREYARLSQYLWMEKRLEFTLGQSSRRLSCLHGISRISSGHYQRAITDDILVDYRRLQLLHQEALLLVSQIATHSMNVVGGAWTLFEGQLEALVESDLDKIIASHSAYINRIKASLVTCFNPAIRSRLIGVFSACLKIDKICLAFEGHLNRSKELALHQKRLRQLEEAGDASIHQQALLQFNEWTHAQHQMLAEFRAQFQSVARQFQVEMDAFMQQMEKESLSLPIEAKDSLSALSILLDYSGYHARRNGFDSQKYLSQPIKQRSV